MGERTADQRNNNGLSETSEPVNGLQFPEVMHQADVLFKKEANRTENNE